MADVDFDDVAEFPDWKVYDDFIHSKPKPNRLPSTSNNWPQPSTLALNRKVYDDFVHPKPNPNFSPSTSNNCPQPSTLALNRESYSERCSNRTFWYKAEELSQEGLDECSQYGRMLLERYNEVKGTNFEFVRLVKMTSTIGRGANVFVQFEAKTSSEQNTPRNFQGLVFADCVYNHRVWPMYCLLLRSGCSTSNYPSGRGTTTFGFESEEAKELVAQAVKELTA